MADRLFRPEAEGRFRPIEDLLEPVRAIRTGKLLAAAVLTLAVAALGAWLCLGSVTETVSVTGVVFPNAGVRKANAVQAGAVSEVLVRSGDTVQAGELLALIPDEDLLSQLDQARQAGSGPEELARLQAEYRLHSFITAPKSGIVRSIRAEGEYLDKGDQVAEITAMDPTDNNQSVVAYVPAGQAQRLETGMEVQVSPDYAPRERYGYLKGYLSEIGRHPVDRAYVEEYDSAYNLSAYIDPGESYLRVEITLLPDRDSESGFAWSNPEGSSLPLSVGVLCENQIVADRLTPLQWLLG